MTQTSRVPPHIRLHGAANKAQYCERCGDCISCYPKHACSPAPVVPAVPARESHVEQHYAALESDDEQPYDVEPPVPTIEDLTVPEATQQFLETIFAPDRALVIKYARLMVSGDAEKMREYNTFVKSRIEVGIHPRATALFEDLVADRVGRHFRIAGRTVPPELSSNPYEFQRAYDLRDRPRTGWLVDQVLMERGFTVLYGPPGCGKSFLALDWALSIVHGIPWHGRETMKGAVGYIAAEGSHEFGPRIAAWQQEHSCSDADIEREDFYVLGTAPDLMKDETAQKLAMATWTIPNLKLIVIDTMARTMYDGDENAARDVGKFIANIEMLRFATDAAILVIHHTTKSTGDVRGSSALPGAATTMLSLVSPKGTHGGLILSCEKQKEAAAFDPPINLQRADITLDDRENVLRHPKGGERVPAIRRPHSRAARADGQVRDDGGQPRRLAQGDRDSVQHPRRGDQVPERRRLHREGRRTSGRLQADTQGRRATERRAAARCRPLVAASSDGR